MLFPLSLRLWLKAPFVCNLTYVNFLGIKIIVINLLPESSALFESNTMVFLDHPSLYFAYEMVGWRDLPISLNIRLEHFTNRKMTAKTTWTKSLMASAQNIVD
jgi:hypothetical protein